MRPPFFVLLAVSGSHNAAALSANWAVFVDRDGTLIEERNYLHRVDEVVIFPAAYGALKRLVEAGAQLIMVTNQSGIGRGFFSDADVEKVHAHIGEQFRQHEVTFGRIYIAPEAPDQPSRGRKPSPQFLFDARDEFGIDLASSYMIGDKLIDLECGWNAGVRASILVRTGYGAETERKHASEVVRAVIVDDLSAAADWILRNE